MFNLPPPEGYLTLKALANVLGVSDMTIAKIARSLKEDGILSEGAWHRSPQVREFFSPEQQAVIIKKAHARANHAHMRSPRGRGAEANADRAGSGWGGRRGCDG